MKKSLILLPALIGGLLFGFGNTVFAQRGGGSYNNNCLIRPQIERPEFERPLYERTTVVRSRPERVQLERTTIERTQVIRPMIDRPAFIRPTFDTCKSRPDSEKVLRRRTLASADASALTGPVLASHGLLDRGVAPISSQVAEAGDCCGGGRSRLIR